MYGIRTPWPSLASQPLRGARLVQFNEICRYTTKVELGRKHVLERSETMAMLSLSKVGRFVYWESSNFVSKHRSKCRVTIMFFVAISLSPSDHASQPSFHLRNTFGISRGRHTRCLTLDPIMVLAYKRSATQERGI